MDIIRNKAIGKRLGELRRRNHLTQGEVAQRLGCTQSLVSKIEAGERSVPLVELWPYARAIEMHYAHLVEELHEALVREGLEPASFEAGHIPN